MHRKRQSRLCRNAVEPWGIPEMITREALQSSADFLYLSPHVEITLSYRTKSSNCCLWASDEWHFLISDIIYGLVASLSLSYPYFSFFHPIKDCFLLPVVGGAGGRRDRWYRFAKRKAERSHIYLSSFVANLGCQDFPIEVRKGRRHRGVLRAGEASRGGQCSKLPWADPTAEHGSCYWQLFYFSLMEFQTCPVHWDSFHLVKTCAVFKLPSDPWSWGRKGKKKPPNIAHNTLKWCRVERGSNCAQIMLSYFVKPLMLEFIY